MSSAADPVLELRGLLVRRGGARVLGPLDLDVARGSIHAVVGPNGSGKTSLLEAVLGLASFTGAIRWRFQGTGRIGYVPQRFQPERPLPLTVEEWLALSRQRRPVCFGVPRPVRARILDLLDRAGLGGLAQRRLAALSGGELRRLLIADALEPLPEVLVCDEPASGLDAQAVEALDRRLLEARDSGTTVLIVSHHPEEVARLSAATTALGRSARVVDGGTSEREAG